MSRGIGALIVVTATLGATSTAAHAACVKTSEGPLVDARMYQHFTTLSGGRQVMTTSLHVCNRRTGHTTVLRRGRLATKEKGRPAQLVYARGRRIATVSAAGRYVAWAEVSASSPDRATVVVRLARFPSGHVVHKWVSRTRGSWVYAASVPLVVNQWADLVWSQNSVWLWRMGRQPVRLDRNGRDELRLFDDGRTVVLGLSARFVDLRPPRLRLGCPDREHFETVVSTPSAFVTRARLRLGEDDALIVWRTCWRSAHRDVIVYGAAEGYKVYPSARLGGYVEPWLLIATETAAPEFLAGSLRLVNVVTGATRSFGEGGPIGQPAWKFEFDAVLLADGSVAWVGIDYSLFVQNMQIVRYALELTRPDGSQAELDTATTGVPSTSPLTALAAHGNSLSWLHDGQPRNYG